MSAVEYSGCAAAVRPVEKDGSTGAPRASAGDGWMKATIVGYPHGRDERPFWACLAYAKVGRKYVHYYHKDAEPDKYSIHTVELGKCVIYPGWNEYIVQAVDAFHTQYNQWLRAYDEFRRRAWAEEDAEATRRLHARVEKWLAENPAPTLKLPEPLPDCTGGA
jgi:hypothetical protein